MEIGKHYTSESTKKSLRAGEKFSLPHLSPHPPPPKKKENGTLSNHFSILIHISRTDTLLCIIALLWRIRHLVLEIKRKREERQKTIFMAA